MCALGSESSCRELGEASGEGGQKKENLSSGGEACFREAEGRQPWGRLGLEGAGVGEALGRAPLGGLHKELLSQKPMEHTFSADLWLI